MYGSKFPRPPIGAHYIWVKDYLGNVVSVPFTIATKVSLSSSSGLVGDSITTSFYGFKGTKELRVVYNNGDIAFAAFPVLTAVNQTACHRRRRNNGMDGDSQYKTHKTRHNNCKSNFVSMTDGYWWVRSRQPQAQ